MGVLDGKHIAILVDDYFEQAEFTGPKHALEKAGAVVEIVAPHGGQVQGMSHAEQADIFPVDLLLEDTDFDNYDALVLPGGALNADSLRMIPEARQAVADFIESGRPLAMICHAPWVLISAGNAAGRTLTSYFTIQDDVRNAGATWVDKEVVIDDNLITSRKPDDVPAFSKAIITMINGEE